MITQAIFEAIHNKTVVDLVSTEATGKTRTEKVLKTGLVLFLQNSGGNLDMGIQAGTLYTGYLFTDQLDEYEIKQNDKFKVGAIYYEVISDGELMNQNNDFEPFYKLQLSKRIAT